MHEQSVRMSLNFAEGQGQDDSMPTVPSMSMELAQKDVYYEA